jgi:Fe-S-cluster-containing hydrogenase component 2
MPKQLKIIPEKCIGCKSCELACSLANDEELNPSASRIAAITFSERGYSLPYHFVSTCRQCADAPCMMSCSVTAITKSTDITKRIIINMDLCIGCGKCVIACPFGVMFFDSVGKKPFKCELCDGNPACVSICPTEAIIYKRQNYYYAKKDDFKMRGYKFMTKKNRKSIKKINSS